jgi:hypothetical protein
MGRASLCEQVGVSRLVMVMLGHGHNIGNMKEVSDELSPKILELAPEGCTTNPIPIMSAGEDIGQKSLIDVQGQDKISGIIVQDVKSGEGQTTLRQIIFENKAD